MLCAEFEERLTDYLDGLLDAQTQVAFNGHALRCPVCHDLLPRRAIARATSPDQFGTVVDRQSLCSSQHFRRPFRLPPRATIDTYLRRRTCLPYPFTTGGKGKFPVKPAGESSNGRSTQAAGKANFAAILLPVQAQAFRLDRRRTPSVRLLPETPAFRRRFLRLDPEYCSLNKPPNILWLVEAERSREAHS